MRIERFRVGSNGAVVIWPAHGGGERIIIYHTGGGEDSEVLCDPGNEKRGIFETLSESGYSILSISSSRGHWGSPLAIHTNDLLFEWIGENLGASRIGIMCQSMGGLSAYNWAIRNPEAILGIYGIYPVTNLGAMLEGELGPAIRQVYSEQGIDLALRLKEFDPMAGIAQVCRPGIPAKHRHGDSDSLVEYVANAVEFREACRNLGGAFDLVTVKGLGHEAHPEFFKPQEVADFMDSLAWPR
jgi:pimeloyl-ACP methyl ester carboxylesterase